MDYEKRIDQIERLVWRVKDFLYVERHKTIGLQERLALEAMVRAIHDLTQMNRSLEVDVARLKPAAEDLTKENLTGVEELDDFVRAISEEGPLAYTWKDKPHRLVFTLVNMLKEERNPKFHTCDCQ